MDFAEIYVVNLYEIHNIIFALIENNHVLSL